MYIEKIDWLIGIVAFIVLVVFFSLQPLQQQEQDYQNERPPTGSGTQTPGEDSSVIVSSGGDTLTDAEDIEPESPKTGYF